MIEWKDIEGYEWYYVVNNLGDIKSLHFWKERILKQNKNIDWYSRIQLKKNGNVRSYLVSRLVAQAFIPNPGNFPCVCHKNEALINWSLNNSIDNLWWWTYKDNVIDKFRKGRASNNYFCKDHPMKWEFWKKHYSARKVLQIDIDNNFIKEWWSLMDVERELWICNTSITSCCRWRLKTAWWYKWSYNLIAQ